jgi:hypothetical protein
VESLLCLCGSFLEVLGGRESVDRDTFVRHISLCVWFPDRNTFIIRRVSLRLVSGSRHLSWACFLGSMM